MLTAVVAGIAHGDQDDPSDPRSQPIALSADSSKVLPLASFSGELGPQCDANRNLFFRTGYTVKTTVVLKVNSSDGSTTVFRPRDAKGEGSEFMAFHVTHGGEVGILVRGRRGEAYVYRFIQADPTEASSIELELQDGLDIYDTRSFLILPNEHIILQGFFNEKAPPGNKGKSYLAEFSSSGKLVRMTVDKSVKVTPDKAASDMFGGQAYHSGQTAAAQGGDGTIYLLTGNSVAVLSPDGTLKRHIKLSPPQNGFSAEFLYMHRGRLVVGFLHSEVGKSANMEYELLDPQSGELIRLYKPGPELGQNLVCWSDDGLIFMGSEKGHVKLITASLK
jgi:hypothetical protein